jgi:fumarate hydratase subunit alpha
VRTVKAEELTPVIKKLCMDANFFLGEDLLETIKKSIDIEESPAGKEVLSQILANAKIAKEEQVAACQDTGFTVVFLDIGDKVCIAGNIAAAVDEGVRQGYKEGYLRKSILDDPLRRKNTGDNTPAVIHLRQVPGDKVHITVAPKGGGSENMSTVKMLAPSAGEDGVVKAVVEQVSLAGANPCPPIIVGVGLGGTFEVAALNAKRALLRPLGTFSADEDTARLEKRMLTEINKLGIGPQGFGGRITCLGVFVERFPCHIASLPLGININCHSSRHKEAEL